MGVYLAEGTVHNMPKDVRQLLEKNQKAAEVWQSLTPLARNEWLCWVTSAKLVETRARRAIRVPKELDEGKRRPCCWSGCVHRERNGH